MPRKAKKRMHRMPPLSLADKLIYWSVFIILAALWVLLLFGTLWLRWKIAFAEAGVVASADHASTFWLFVPWMTFFLMTFILWLLPYQDRKPIFGKRGFRYGPPAWPKIYPVFMKNKPYVWVSEHAKKTKRQTAMILLLVLLIGFIPYPWSLYGRDCLYTDGSIRQYSMFGSLSREVAAGEIAQMEIGTFRYSTGRYRSATHWGVYLKLTTDEGKTYRFEHRDFSKDVADKLETMLHLKGRYHPRSITYAGTENLEKYVASKNMTPKQIDTLYRLFGMT